MPVFRILRCLVLPSLLLLAGCASAPRPLDFPEPLPQIDLARYAGDWYVIANIPYFAERDKVAARVNYRRREDGRIDDLYFFRERFDGPEKQWTGFGEVVDPSTNARWRVQFVWPFWVDYVIHDVGPDYQWALAGHPSRDYAWIFAREPRMDDARYEALRARFAGWGYDARRIQRIPQFPEDEGKPGYQ